ncbi:MAG: hypothetical protein COA70_09530 [Planctomycetota bacterium]|nr:MAG: hypothetical protein COA70_09530 [Planctomycetota bacterium]
MATSKITVTSYIDNLDDDRKAAVKKLRQVIKKNLPKGFKEVMNYNMPSYVVPHSEYPDGYHCAPELPLPFLSMASQKNFIALYHMGIYADPKLLAWFQKQWPKHVKTKLDMGKSCIRFKKIDAIPYDLIGELVAKMSMEAWVKAYDKNFKS